MNRGIIIDPEMIPESTREFEPNPGYTYGKVELMGGSIELQLVPLLGPDSTPMHFLGPNMACLRELETIMSELRLADIKRTMRTILR